MRYVLAGFLTLAAACADDAEGFRGSAGAWTLVLLPDTQCYSLSFPEIFEAQGAWIGETAERLDIRAAVHLGDVTENNVPEQWAVATSALAPLSGRVPFLVAPGNHDLGDGGTAATRTSSMREHFPLSAQMDMATFVEAFDDEPWNVAHRIRGDRFDFVLVDLEFGPRRAVLDWAAGVLARFPDALAIVATHAYLDGDGVRYDHLDGTPQPFCPHDYGVATDEVTDGQEIWERLVSPAPNSRLVVSGHVPNGFAISDDTAGDGHLVHQLMADWQTGTACPTAGGDGRGYLVTLEVTEREDGVDVRVRAYSPWENAFEHERETTLRLDPP